MTLLAVSTQEVIEAILGSIDEAIHAVDENGITIFYNTVAAKHDGSKIEKVLGKHLLEAFPSLSRENKYVDESIRYKKTNRSSSAALSKFKWGRHLYSKYDVTYFHRWKYCWSC
ncbi:L-lysine aminomutase regulator [Bacillus cereus G9241]|nr:L-lysine aminomutase regulator [Bacillus cereus G9241]